MTHNLNSRDRIPNDPVLIFENSLSSSTDVELLTVDEAASFLTISKSGIRRLQERRQLPFIKVGTRVRFAKQDLIAYLASHRIEPLNA